MVGLGGAEFRLPLLVSLFGFAALSAVILNKAMSLVVVLVALPARLAVVPASELGAHWTIAANLLAGSLLGAWGRSYVGRSNAQLNALQGARGTDGPHGRRPPDHTQHRPPWGLSACRSGPRYRVGSWRGSASA